MTFREVFNKTLKASWIYGTGHVSQSLRAYQAWAGGPVQADCTKLMRLGSPNRIDDDSDSKGIYIDRRLTPIRIPTIKIELTIPNLIQNQSIFDINQLKSIVFDINSIFYSILIDLMSIIQSKIVDLYRKWSIYIENRRFISKNVDLYQK